MGELVVYFFRDMVVLPLVFLLLTWLLYELLKRNYKQVAGMVGGNHRPPRTTEDVALYLKVVEEYDTLYHRRKYGVRGGTLHLKVWSVGIVTLAHLVGQFFWGVEIVPPWEVGGGGTISVPEEGTLDGGTEIVPLPILPSDPIEKPLAPTKMENIGEEGGMDGGTIPIPLFGRGGLLGIGMDPCLSSPPQERYCFYRDLWKVTLPTTYPPNPKERSYYIDEWRDIYYSLQTRDGEVLVRERDLVGVLTNLPHQCICPSRLGVDDHSHYFLYKDSHTGNESWVVMNDPVIERKSGKRMSKGDLSYHEDLTISFSSPVRQPNQETVTRIEEYNNKIIYYEHGKDVPPHILYQLPKESVGRISLHLHGEDAACFTYCSSFSA